MNLNEIKFLLKQPPQKKKLRSHTKKGRKKRYKKNGRRNTHDSGFDANSRGDFDARERRLRKAFLPL
jgi:hypothetical protein